MVTATINKRISIAETDKCTVIKHTYDKAIVSHKHRFGYDLNEVSKYSRGDPLATIFVPSLHCYTHKEKEGIKTLSCGCEVKLTILITSQSLTEGWHNAELDAKSKATYNLHFPHNNHYPTLTFPTGNYN
jgi:hypothetical protein